MTQEQLGLSCGIKKQSIFKYETGIVTNIPLDRLEKIAEVLDVHPAYLLGWDTYSDHNSQIESPLLETLAKNFNCLNLEGQEKLVDISDDFVKSGKYKKMDQLDLAHEA